MTGGGGEMAAGAGDYALAAVLFIGLSLLAAVSSSNAEV
jgi:hypothetical protein